jgi:hypothetical protein
MGIRRGAVSSYAAQDATSQAQELLADLKERVRQHPSAVLRWKESLRNNRAYPARVERSGTIWRTKAQCCCM